MKKKGKIHSTGERVTGFAMLFVAILYLIGAFMIAPPTLKQQLGPDAFPKGVGIIMILLACIHLFQQFTGGLTEEEKKEMDEHAKIVGAEEKVEQKIDWKIVLAMLVLMVFYAFSFERLGYAIATFMFFIVGALLLDRRHLLRDSFIAIISSFGLFYLFTIFLHVQLPAGLLAHLGQGQ
jgi:putative tricarboxylic transport membrane protein